MNDTDTIKSIIDTLAWFDIFDTPLTKEEIYTWLWTRSLDSPSKEVLYTQLYDMREQGQLGHEHGFFCLPGRESLFARRQLSTPIIDKKMDIAKRAVQTLRWIPFLHAVFVCNTVASASADECSDIDVFVVIRNGRLWLTRLLVTLTLALFRFRRNKTHVANKICLSFFVTDAHLDLSDVTLGEPDIYLMYWIDQLIPVFDPTHVRAEILKQNAWATQYLPNAFRPYILHPRWRVEESAVSKKVKRMFEAFWGGGYGDLIEKQAKGVQEKKMAMNFGSIKDEPDSRVVIDDTMLKFHENDRRAQYREEWRARVSNIRITKTSEYSNSHIRKHS